MRRKQQLGSLALYLIALFAIRNELQEGLLLPVRSGKSPVMFEKSGFMTMARVRSAAESDRVQLDEAVSLHPDNVSEGGDYRDGRHAEQVWDLNYLTNQSADSTSAIQKTQSL